MRMIPKRIHGLIHLTDWAFDNQIVRPNDRSTKEEYIMVKSKRIILKPNDPIFSGRPQVYAPISRPLTSNSIKSKDDAETTQQTKKELDETLIDEINTDHEPKQKPNRDESNNGGKS
jgi:hypothetical protein